MVIYIYFKRQKNKSLLKWWAGKRSCELMNWGSHKCIWMSGSWLLMWTAWSYGHSFLLSFWSINCSTWSVIVLMPIVIITPIQREQKIVAWHCWYFMILSEAQFLLTEWLKFEVEILFVKVSATVSDSKIKSHVIFARYIWYWPGLALNSIFHWKLKPPCMWEF